MKLRNLGFSEPFLKVQYLEDVRDLRIEDKTILLNVDAKSEILIEEKPLRPWSSSIFANASVQSARKLVRINVKPDVLSLSPFKYAPEIKNKWSHIHDIVPLPHLKNTTLWRSDKEKINGIAFNLWFASAGTDCGIHNEHGFKELHTQAFGFGRMQKFHQNDRTALYQEVFMGPGYTHEPFYDEEGKYPWHQYHADTDCVWLVAEFK
jgi:hypothetical protein